MKKSKAQSTEARDSGGLSRSSVDVPVMGAERRARIVLLEHAPT